jgi:uncharacterized repeat protein (TIGR01451 family)
MSATRGGSALPGGSDIAAGDVITITTTWNTGDWSSVTKVLDCFQLNGSDVGSLDIQEKPTANDGLFTYTFTVPSNVANGDTLCARGDLAGTPTGGNPSTQKSNELCWGSSTPPPPPPTNPDVVVAKKASKTSINSGDSVTFTLTATNTGTAKATDVVITDTVPAGLTITGTSASCAVSGQKVTCSVGDLAAGADISVTIDVTATTAACPSIDNQAHVQASNEPVANQGNNDSNTVTLNVTCPPPPPGDPDVEIHKSTSAPAKGVAPGDAFTFTLSATNSGGSTANDVVITDSVPAGLNVTGASFTGGSAGPGNCGINGQNVTCNVGNLGAGNSATVTIDVKATDTACPNITNNAHVSASNEPSAAQGNNGSNDVTVLVNCTPPPPPNPGIDVTITKTNNADGRGGYSNNEEAPQPGSDVPFLVVITNTGTPDITLTSLVDTFAGQSIDLIAGPCSQLAGTKLVSGESVVCNFTLKNYSPPAASSGKVNTARVCAQNMAGDQTACAQDDSTVTSSQVQGETVTPPATTPPGGTAFTGSNGTVSLGLLTLILLLLGSGLVFLSNRRRRRAEEI